MKDTFNNIKNPMLRAYNRYVAAMDMLDHPDSDKGKLNVVDYLAQFGQQEAMKVGYVAMYISTQGQEAFMRMLKENTTPELDDETVHKQIEARESAAAQGFVDTWEKQSREYKKQFANAE